MTPNAAAVAHIGTGMPSEDAVVEPAVIIGKAGHRIALGEHRRQRLGDAEGGERDDERRQVDVGDQRAVDDAEGSTDQHRSAERHPQRQSVAPSVRHDDAAQPEHRAEAEIDTLGQDHQRHAKGDDHQHGDLQRDVGQVGDREEIRRPGS